MASGVSKDKRDNAARRVLQAKKAPQAYNVEAKRFAVPLRTVRHWVTRYENQRKRSAGAVPRSDTPKPIVQPNNPPVSKADAVPAPPGDEFEQAMHAAGNPSETEPVADAPVDDPPLPEPEEAKTPVPTISPEKLIAFSELIVTKATKLYASNRKVVLPDELLSFSEDEKMALSLGAPAAASFIPEDFGNPKIGLTVFCVTLGFCMFTRFAAIKQAIVESRTIAKDNPSASPLPPPTSTGGAFAPIQVMIPSGVADTVPK